MKLILHHLCVLLLFDSLHIEISSTV